MKQLYLRIRDFERPGIDLLETLWSSHQVEVDGASRQAIGIKGRFVYPYA